MIAKNSAHRYRVFVIDYRSLTSHSSWKIISSTSPQCDSFSFMHCASLQNCSPEQYMHRRAGSCTKKGNRKGEIFSVEIAEKDRQKRTERYPMTDNRSEQHSRLLRQPAFCVVDQFSLSLARYVLRRKKTFITTAVHSAMGNANHTSSSCPVSDSRNATGSSTTI